MLSTKKYKDAGVSVEIRYMSESGEFDENAQILRKRYYDNEGRLTLDSNFADFGDFGSKYVKYTYDEAGKLLKKEMFGYDAIPLVHTYIYDNDGKLIESRFASAEARRFYYTYNDQGYLIEEVAYMFFVTDKPIERKSEKKTFEYDEQNRVIKELNWKFLGAEDLEWELQYESSFEYDGKNMISAGSYHHIYEISNSARIEYNDKGLTSKVTPKDEEGNLNEEFSQFFYYVYR